jgi:integrase
MLPPCFRELLEALQIKGDAHSLGSAPKYPIYRLNGLGETRTLTPLRATDFESVSNRVAALRERPYARPYFNPHSFRKSLVKLGMQLRLPPEHFKAWSQNLGHEQIMTTFTSYGTVARHRQAEIMRALCDTKVPPP